MANVIDEINAIQEEMNKKPEYRKRQLETQYVLLKDRIQHFLKEKEAIQAEITKLKEKAKKEGFDELTDDIFTLSLMLDFD